MTYGRHIARDFFLLVCLFFFVFLSPVIFGQTILSTDLLTVSDVVQLRLLVKEALEYQDFLVSHFHLHVKKDFHTIISYRKAANSDESALNLNFFNGAVLVMLSGFLLYCSSGAGTVSSESSDVSSTSFISEFFSGAVKKLLGAGGFSAVVFYGYYLYSWYIRVSAVCKMIVWLQEFVDYASQFLKIVSKISSFVGFDKSVCNNHALEQMHTVCLVKLQCLQRLLLHVPYGNGAKIYRWFLSGNAHTICVLMFDVHNELVAARDALTLLDEQLRVH